MKKLFRWMRNTLFVILSIPFYVAMIPILGIILLLELGMTGNKVGNVVKIIGKIGDGELDNDK